MSRLSEIREREQKASTGWDENDGLNSPVDDCWAEERPEDLAFVVHSREDIPWLLEMVEEAEKIIGCDISNDPAANSWLRKVGE
jgi:hypothetical protein